MLSMLHVCRPLKSLLPYSTPTQTVINPDPRSPDNISESEEPSVAYGIMIVIYSVDPGQGRSAVGTETLCET